MHLPTQAFFRSLPTFTVDAPMRILMSGCLAGQPCGVDGTSYGQHAVGRLATLSNVRLVTFCPEDFSFGTPRETPNIHGGDGFDVLDGRARVLTESGVDWTDGMIAAAERMLQVARDNAVHIAVLMDMSAACGSQVISDGHRALPQEQRRYRRGPGVGAALLMRNGITAVSQRDHRTLQWLYRTLDSSHVVDPTAIDHHESEWYCRYFGT